MFEKKKVKRRSAIQWIAEHVRPHAAWVGNEKINLKEDDFKTVFQKIEDNLEIGIKINFKW